MPSQPTLTGWDASPGRRHRKYRPSMIGGRMVVQPAPGLPGRQVHHDDPVRPGQRRVGDERQAGVAATQVETDVIEVRARPGHVGREQDRLDGGIGAEVDADQLGPAGTGRLESRRTGVEQPQATGRVDHDALHRHQRRRVGLAVRIVVAPIGVGPHLPVAQLDRRGRHLVAPTREVHEDPTGVADRDSRRHGRLERRHGLQYTQRLVGLGHRRPPLPLVRFRTRCRFDHSSPAPLPEVDPNHAEAARPGNGQGMRTSRSRSPPAASASWACATRCSGRDRVGGSRR
jgi:hypothetical protein